MIDEHHGTYILTMTIDISKPQHHKYHSRHPLVYLQTLIRLPEIRSIASWQPDSGEYPLLLRPHLIRSLPDSERLTT